MSCCKLLLIAATAPLPVVAATATTESAEIVLRAACRASGTLVRLRDLADIVGGDAPSNERLGAIDLMPAPVPGAERRLRASDVADLLRNRGVNLTEHRLSGAARLVVLPPSAPAKARRPRAPGRVAARRAATRVREAIAARLTAASGREEPWEIDLRLTDQQVATLDAAGGPCAAEGGRPPWTGRQHFTIRCGAVPGDAGLAIVAQVSLPQASVVAVRSLARGTVVSAGDVRLVREKAAHRGTLASRDAFRTIDEVIGMETTRSVPAGQRLDRTVLRRPLLVRRGDIVTVYARTGGIQVRTTARARDDASMGELVMVESIRDRRRYFARVTGTREVDVLAGGTRARDAAARTPAAAATRAGLGQAGGSAEPPARPSLRQASYTERLQTR